jgi:hypothetical protein
MRRQLDQLRNLGISLIEVSQIEEWLNSDTYSKKQVLTSEDIRQARLDHQNSLIIGKSTLVTPLAADLAAESYIQIIRK